MIHSTRRFASLVAFAATAAQEASAQTIQTLIIGFTRDPPLPVDVPLSSTLTISIIVIVGIVGAVYAKHVRWRLVPSWLGALIAVAILFGYSGQSWAPPRPGLSGLELVLVTSPTIVSLPALSAPAYGYAVYVTNGTDDAIKLLAVALDEGIYHIDFPAGSGFGTPCQIGQVLQPGGRCTFAAQSQPPF